MLNGRKIKTLRQSLDMSQGQLAEAAGVTQSFISDLERNAKCPSMGVLKKISDALGVTIDDLYE